MHRITRLLLFSRSSIVPASLALLTALLMSVMQAEPLHAADSASDVAPDAVPSIEVQTEGQTDEGRLYWSSSSNIYRAAFDGSEQETVLAGLPLRNPVFDATGSRMYGIGSDGIIRRADVSGTGLTELIAPGDNPVNLRIDPDGGKLYWVDQSRVRRVNLDGSQLETLVSGLTLPRGLIVDVSGGYLYWMADSLTIQRAPLDGGEAETVYTPDESEEVGCLGHDPVDGKLYWQVRETGFDGPVLRADEDGSNVEMLPLSDLCPRLNAETRKLYWFALDVSNTTLQSADLDGTNVETLVENLSAPNNLSFDLANGKLYWYEAALNDSKIRRADLGGGTAEDLVEFSTNPSGFALNLAQQQMVWEIDGLLQRADLDGENQTTIVVGVRVAGGLALDLAAGRIYWTDVNSVRFANLDGTAPAILWSQAPGIGGFSLNPSVLENDAAAGKLYWIVATYTGGPGLDTKMFRANLDGTAVEELDEIGLKRPYAVDFVNQKLYGIKPPQSPGVFTSTIASADLDGTGVTPLAVIDVEVADIAVDGAGGKLYVTFGGTQGRLQEMNLDGSQVTDLITDIDTPGLVQVDTQSGKIYWISDPVGDPVALMRANLDGSEPETVLEEPVSGLAFDPEGLGTPDDETPGDDSNTMYLPTLRAD